MTTGRKRKRRAAARASVKELTPHGKAQREYDAAQRSAWDSYSRSRVIISGPPNARQCTTVEAGAIAAARAGDVSRLLDLLRAHRPLAEENDLDALADYIEATAKRGRGAPRDEPVHEAARLADAIMHIWNDYRVSDRERTAAITIACGQIEGELGVVVDPERVRGLLRQPKTRRLPKKRRP
jgi:hypothetical protein